MMFSTKAPLLVVILSALAFTSSLAAQEKALINMFNSPHAHLWGVDETFARWTGGFRGGRFDVRWESSDLDGVRIDDIIIPADMKFRPKTIVMGGCEMSSLVWESDRLVGTAWGGSLYRELDTARRKVSARLIPYFAFGNCGHSEMTVWMPLERN